MVARGEGLGGHARCGIGLTLRANLEGLAKPPGVVRPTLWSLEGVAKPLVVVCRAIWSAEGLAKPAAVLCPAGCVP